ncbi:Cdc6/Cdc18 family protein [Halobaculum gomorrense]|uniref:ORC1-type DNA replication protein n=1 Tax=Halobaculum gomorrense TaxID=43928 RepID=A0A1M5UT45_9EURY|nr:cell division control protein 6 [Halobaculum gomorrense]
MRSFGGDDTIFADMDRLNPNTQTYQPETLPEREAELNDLHSTLEPAAQGYDPINAFVYGPTGQGKTVGIGLKTTQLQQYADKHDKDVCVVHVRCKGMEKSYHVMTHLIKALREKQYGPGEELPSGHPKKTLFEMIISELEAIGGTVIVILDEIDAIGNDDYVLYELSRANPEDVRLSLIGITNDYRFRDNLNADVRSSLGEDEIEFAPYDANQLRNILARRAAGGLRDTSFSDPDNPFETLESDVLAEDAIPLASAYAAQDSGDAREAIKLMFRACRFADDAGEAAVTAEHVQEAHEYLERAAVERGIRSLPMQRALALLTVTQATITGTKAAETKDLHDIYEVFCNDVDADAISERRFRDKLNDLADSGILTKETRGRGQGLGKTNRYELDVKIQTVLDNLEPDSRLGEFVEETLRPRHK